MKVPQASLYLIAAAAVAACSDGGAEGVTNNTPLVAHFQQDPVIPDNGTAPSAFDKRERLPSCGSYAWSTNEGPPEGLWTCLAESRERGRPTEFIVQAPSTSNHVTVSYYRLPADGDVIEVWNREVPGEWSRSECDVFDAKSGPSSCEAVDTE